MKLPPLCRYFRGGVAGAGAGAGVGAGALFGSFWEPGVLIWSPFWLIWDPFWVSVSGLKKKVAGSS